MKKIAILGSTGSIGTQTLEIVRNQPDLQVVSLAAGTNTALMEQQIREFRPRMAAMWSEEAAADLAARVADIDVKIVSGMDGLLEISTLEEAETLVVRLKDAQTQMALELFYTIFAEGGILTRSVRFTNEGKHYGCWNYME